MLNLLYKYIQVHQYDAFYINYASCFIFRFHFRHALICGYRRVRHGEPGRTWVLFGLNSAQLNVTSIRAEGTPWVISLNIRKILPYELYIYECECRSTSFTATHTNMIYLLDSLVKTSFCAVYVLNTSQYYLFFRKCETIRFSHYVLQRLFMCH